MGPSLKDERMRGSSLKDESGWVLTLKGLWVFVFQVSEVQSI